MSDLISSAGCRYKLKNIEETEAAKKLLHEKRFIGQTKKDSTNSWSHNADYFQRGKDYAEKLRRGLSRLIIFVDYLFCVLSSKTLFGEHAH